MCDKMRIVAPRVSKGTSVFTGVGASVSLTPFSLTARLTKPDDASPR
jgi:hypothetical protein